MKQEKPVGSSPEERLNDEVRKSMREEVKNEIKDSIDGKYQQIEGMLNDNMASGSPPRAETDNSRISKNTAERPPLSASKKMVSPKLSINKKI